MQKKWVQTVEEIKTTQEHQEEHKRYVQTQNDINMY